MAIGGSSFERSIGRLMRAVRNVRPLDWRGPGGLVIADLFFAVACVLAIALLLSFGQYATFIGDEWSFIAHRRGWSFAGLMHPHNEHWVLTLTLVYKALFETIGLRSYLPYFLILLATHVAAASAVYVLMRHQNGQLVALAGGMLMLFLGTGSDNLFWAFQIGFVGATAAGAWTVVLLLTRPLSRRAEVAAAGLLLVAVATSGVALFFLVATAAMLALDPVRRRQLWVVVPATVAYVAWYVTYGSTAIDVHRDPFTGAGLQEVPSYVVTGVANAIGKVSGWGDQVGLVLFVGLSLATAWHLVGTRRPSSAVIAGYVGLMAQFVVTGLVRAQLGVSQATAPRYVYIAAVFLLIATAGWIGSRLAEPRLRPIAVLGTVLVVALGTNLSVLPSSRDAYRGVADSTRAAIMVIDRYGGSPAISAERGLSPIPGKRILNQIQAELGLPLDDVFRPDAPPPSPSIMDTRIYQLVADAFALDTTAELPRRVMEPEVRGDADVMITMTSSCMDIVVVGPDPQVLLRMRGGDALTIEVEEFGEIQAFLGLHAPPTEANSKRFPLAPGSVHLLHVPDVDEVRPWMVRIDPPAVEGSTRICVVAGSEG